MLENERTPTDALPVPGPDALRHSARVTERLRAEIAAAGGELPFARFMEIALHEPGLGYYSGGARKFGAEGDFVTAPEISPLFARCLARELAPVLAATGGDILELGAGTGRMAADLLQALAGRDTLPRRYRILELSAELRARQRETLEACAPSFLGMVEWLERLPASGFRGAIVANEVVDAMPVQRFRVADGIRELGVRTGAAGFEWCELQRPTPGLIARVEALGRELGATRPQGYVSELNLALEAWVAALAGALDEGLMLLIDYGFPRREYYHPERSGGTLMCHYRHRAHSDPFIYPGLQDITAHVDFTALAEAGHAAGLTVSGYTTQAFFLAGAGIDALLAEADGSEAERVRLAQGAKQLLLPSEMGELFKVIALSRGIEGLALQGFSVRDLRHKL